MTTIKKYHITHLGKWIISVVFLHLFLLSNYTNPIYANIPTEEEKICDSLKIKFKTEKDDSLKVLILNDLAWYLAPSEMDNSIYYVDSALILSQKYDLKSIEGQLLNTKGEALRNKGLFEKSLEVHKSALKIFEALNDQLSIAKTESNIGICYFSLSDFSNAFTHFDNSLDLYIKYDDQDGILNANSYIGVVFNSFGQHEKAIEYFSKSLKIAEKLKNESKMGTQYNNIGLSYSDLKEYTKSIEYYEKAVEQFKKTGDDFNYSIALGNLGIPQTEIKQYFEAINSFTESLKYAEKLGDKYGIAHQYGNLGELYLKMEKDANFKSLNNVDVDLKGLAIENLQKSIHEFELIGAIDDQKDYLLILSEVYVLSNNYKKALTSYQNAVALKDSIQAKENRKLLAELEIKQELDNKENEIKLLNQDKEYDAMIQTAISILAMLILFIAGLIFYFFKKKQKDNILLQNNIKLREEVENTLRLNEVELTKHKSNLEKLVKERTKKLENEILDHKQTEEALLNAIERAEIANNAKSVFLANMSHELRTPLVGILGYSDLLSNVIEDDEAREMAQGINRTGKRLLSTLSLVLDLARVESDKFEIQYSDVDLIGIMKDNYHNFKAMANNKGIDLILDLHTDSLEFTTDIGMINVILENLINNAIKFTQKGKIEIRSSILDDFNEQQLCIQVSDSGVGIKKQDIPKIFEEFKQLSEGFTKDFQGSGLGLSITKKFVDLLGGTIEVDSEPGIGTTFTIKFPIKIKAVA